MNCKPAVRLSVSLAALLAGAARTAESADPLFANLPFGCFVNKAERIPADQAAAIGKRLGTPLAELSNNFLTIHGRPLQANLLRARTGEEAEALFRKIGSMKNDPAFCLRREQTVIEFCGDDPALATKAAFELGLRPKPSKVHYRITADLAAVDQADYMAFNSLFNAFLDYRAGRAKQEAEAKIRELAKRFKFGERLTLAAPGRGNARPAYEFKPEPTSQPAAESGAQAAYAFGGLARVLDIPYATVKIRIACDRTGFTPSDEKTGERLTAATAFWPVDDPAIQSLAKKITAGRRLEEEKVQAVLEWLAPGKNIKSEGPTGSRWGVKKVLKQGYGHCWDSADCFVTLARAAGIPCRQVGGWLYGTSGHIWAEVLYEGKGWQQVDPTGGGRLACGIYHIPYFRTETGEMPILYVSMPKIENVE